MLLKVSSKNLTNQQGHNFTISYNNFVIPYEKNYEIALVQYSMPYSWHNISSKYNNNILTYTTNNGSSYQTLTISNGNFSVEELQDYISAQLGNNSIFFQANFNTGRVELVLDPNFGVDFSAANSFRTILGFNSSIVLNSTASPTTNSATNNADINRGIEAISIHTDLVDPKNSLLNDKFSSSCFSFVPKTAPNTILAENISNPIYVGVSIHGQVNNISFSIRDNLGNLVDLEGESVTLTFHIREHLEVLHN